jgi:2-aminoadipate transaminase
MLKALQENFPAQIEWQEPEGGLYFWTRLPRKMKSGRKSRLFQAALAHDVLYVPGELCYADDAARSKPDHELRLSFGSATEEHIWMGIKRLGTVLSGLMG